jgi:hypothetical protein
MPAINQQLLPVLCDIVPRGDGSFTVTPRKIPPNTLEIDGQIKAAVRIREAARMLGVSPRTAMRLLQMDKLQGNRPSGHVTLVTIESIEAHKQATKDPFYWDKKV